jgi:uncharacterized hydrophobic protein (TIGR00271 family)
MTVVVVIHAPEEAEGLIRWGMLFALSMEDERLAVLHGSAIQATAIDTHIQSWAQDHPVVPELEIRCFGADADEDTILDELRKPSVSLAVLGQNRFASCGSGILAMNRKVFERAVCDSVLIRLSSRSVEECDTILIPSAGGPHSCLALKLGSRIASRFEGTITPLFVEPEIGDEDGQAVGLRILQRTIVEAGLDPNDSDHIQPEVVVSNVVEKGVYEASHRKSYDLILCGASNGLTVKRKLFGAIPPKMVDGDEGMALAVIRRRYPVSHRIRDSFERFFQLRIPQLERESRIALFDRLQTNSRWSFDFVFLMILATGIASFGLMQNSPAVVIGAMLVAPLMTPLLGSGLALVQGNLPLLRACLKSICLGFLAALLVGGFLGWIGPLGELTGELAGRGNPSLLDFGVAMLSGVAASYCVARPGLSSALAGVAIAAALVPPIATVGISLTLQEWTNAEGAALLFGTNVVTIILASCLTFFAIGIRGQTGNKQLWAHRSIALLLVLLVLLIIPLAATLLIRSASRS